MSVRGTFMTGIRAFLIGCLLVLASPFVGAQETVPNADSTSPFFIYLGSFTTKDAAQNHAMEFGGWVLRTDLYSGLTPGFYAAVIGPFSDRSDAEAALQEVILMQPEAMIRSAGSPTLPPSLGNPNLLSAVLGDLRVVVSSDTSSSYPCAPQEPHTTILVGFVSPILGENDAPLGGFWLVDRTGEVIPIRGCDGEEEQESDDESSSGE